MKHVTFLAVLVVLATACNPQKENKVLKQSDFPTPPVAEVQPKTFVEFDQQRVDNYYWMRDKTDPKVIDYLNAENAYTETVMSSTSDLQKQYNEIWSYETSRSYPTLRWLLLLLSVGDKKSMLHIVDGKARCTRRGYI